MSAHVNLLENRVSLGELDRTLASDSLERRASDSELMKRQSFLSLVDDLHKQEKAQSELNGEHTASRGVAEPQAGHHFPPVPAHQQKLLDQQQPQQSLQQPWQPALDYTPTVVQYAPAVFRAQPPAPIPIHGQPPQFIMQVLPSTPLTTAPPASATRGSTRSQQQQQQQQQQASAAAAATSQWHAQDDDHNDTSSDAESQHGFSTTRPADKKQRRLQKNREAAKECRRKKKEYISTLEDRVKVLEQQNSALTEEVKRLQAALAQRS
ncbi:hypothetical protein CAOG_04938 [Capsaspora owczarzaki ATCC 30864]|uniref:BZIP domain-containing protein n=1 Tax=Capsaspora owczarzaki (strain ATCC 30864) TaxID=595528 RepID=A0A0D2X3G5_CAPO3|nr:hypothetical protein CAOG_04938 [Capsaspora owczarzaki ATCC 30864]KJE94269.1 hypothetical protein CAOG_004938 [Capsaspora owczarzaki ATCC 30864]|eukprot:XP_004347689.1 hypothetical protein CAOG_04938 [Capsaspora owczarzaki ATCC 30864]